MRKSPNGAAYQQLREALVDLRRLSAKTQAEVAFKLGRPQSFVSKYESGERYLDLVEFIEVCEVLGASPPKVVQSLIERRDAG